MQEDRWLTSPQNLKSPKRFSKAFLKADGCGVSSEAFVINLCTIPCDGKEQGGVNP